MSVTNTKQNSLLGLSQTVMENYMQTLVTTYKHSSERRQALSFLQDLIEKDKAALRLSHTLLRAAEVKLRSLYSLVDHDAPFESFFTYTPPTAAAFLSAMQTNDAALHVGGVNFSQNLVVNANNILIDGEGNSGSALTNALTCGSTVDGLLRLQGSNITIKGIKFKRTTAGTSRSLVMFTGACSNLVFEDCIFESPAVLASEDDQDTRWIDGEGQYFSGKLTIKNCRVTGFTDWMLADATTASSATPSTAMSDVLIDKCYFQNKGSMAFRQLVSSEKLGTFTFTNNKLEVLGDDLHNLFWSAVEANNFGKVVVTDNNATGNRKINDDRGFLQTWSRSAVWDLEIKNNILNNYNVGYQLAFNSVAGNFYGNSAESFVTLLASQLTTVDNAVSTGYPWDWDTTDTMQTVVSGAILPASVPASLHIVDSASDWQSYSG